MPRLRDISGQRFGRLLVTDKYEIRNKQTYWFCICDCGNQKYIKYSSLRNGSIKSCGCLRTETSLKNIANTKKFYIEDFINKNINNIKILNESTVSGKWNFLCFCGKIFSNYPSRIISGHTTSCGCNHNKKGDKHHSWKGGYYKNSNTLFRKTNEYKIWRSKIYNKYNFTCIICQETGGKLNAHHLYSFETNIKKRLDTNNGVCLCQKCHKEFHLIYTTRNNTPEQFLEFFNNKKVNYDKKDRFT